ADTDHVLGHEMVHVFQYDLAATDFDTLQVALERMPLWFVEGLAEYLSIGRNDPQTSMWLRDAVIRNKFPTVQKLSDPRYFPYRFGHAFWAFVGATWGDNVIPALFRAVGGLGLERGIPYALGVSADSLSHRWAETVRSLEQPVAQSRRAPESFAGILLSEKTGSGTMNISPVLSPDGRYVTFLSEKDLFTVELFLADARTGKVIGKLTDSEADPHFGALRFIDSAGTWSPDGKRLAYVVTRKGDNVLAILDVDDRDVVRRIRLPGRESMSNPSWSPDGRSIVVSANHSGISDLYLIDLESGQSRRLTDDKYADLQPSWSPDGRTIAFATDRGPDTNFEALRYGRLRIGLYDLASGNIRLLEPFPGAKHVDPQFSADGGSLYFLSDRDGVSDVYRLELGSGAPFRVTSVQTGVTGITDLSPALSVSRLSLIH
ncbi:MAG: peptidase S9, partial [Candidatus Eisenbacteria bacterium]|nr:peptidase S9 [Candidatus Eisenbacteria bacterium]